MKYAFVESTTCCYDSLLRIARKLGKKTKTEVVDVSMFDAMRPQIVVICMNTVAAEGFLEAVVKDPERADNIQCLFIEQTTYHIPEDLNKLFTIVPIDLDYRSDIPACISLKELAFTVTEQVKRECLKSKEHIAMDEIGKLTNSQLYKPKKVMSEVRKFLFKKQLEKFGTLEEVFKELQNN